MEGDNYMKTTKFKENKCLCDNCSNIAIKVVDMDKNRLWLCKKCNDELIKNLKGER